MKITLPSYAILTPPPPSNRGFKLSPLVQLSKMVMRNRCVDCIPCNATEIANRRRAYPTASDAGAARSPENIPRCARTDSPPRSFRAQRDRRRVTTDPHFLLRVHENNTNTHPPRRPFVVPALISPWKQKKAAEHLAAPRPFCICT